MSVIMTLRVKGDPKKVEEFAAEDPGRMRAIADAAEQHGLIAHRFYGNDDGEIMVVDEWPEAENFEKFFQEQQDQIGPMMQRVGVTETPQPQFWRKLETHDEVGWGA